MPENSVQTHQKNINERHFIFGYGSLINSVSRNVTGDTGEAVAVKIKGFERHWSRISSEYGMSSVVVIANETGATNGVIVEVDENEFNHFDERERGYKRVLVAADQIEFYNTAFDLANEVDSVVKIWIYQTDKIILPCAQYPVVFSYLDVILSGCLEYSTEFCDDFVSLTQGWQHAMLNDRTSPRYPRVQTDLNTGELNQYIKAKAILTNEQIDEGYTK